MRIIILLILLAANFMLWPTGFGAIYDGRVSVWVVVPVNLLLNVSWFLFFWEYLGSQK